MYVYICNLVFIRVTNETEIRHFFVSLFNYSMYEAGKKSMTMCPTLTM